MAAAEIRAAVLAEFAAAGIIPTQEQVDDEVAVRLQALIDADVAAYVEGQLETDLAAALRPLLRLELSLTEFGRLESQGLLYLRDYDLIELRDTGRWYYRDHYHRRVEPTRRAAKIDNLGSKPRYRNTASGREFLPPRVVATAPAKDAEEVALDAPVSATFDGPVDAFTLTLARPNGEVVDGDTARDSAGRTVTFAPAQALTAGSAFTATVTGTAPTGTATHTWDFIT